MDRQEFYKFLRAKNSGVFGTSLSKIQVNVMERILDDAKDWSNEELAYAFATAYHEAKMIPQRESLYYSTPERIRKVWPSRFPTTASAQPYVKNPQKLANKVYNGRLGNRPGSNDGWNYRGGGLPQETGRSNYRTLSDIVGVDLVSNPNAILEPVVSVTALLNGLKTGRWRGPKLSDFINWQKCDFVNARSIVNADVTANGKLVAKYAEIFLNALEHSKRDKKKVIEEKPKTTNWFIKLIKMILKGS